MIKNSKADAKKDEEKDLEEEHDEGSDEEEGEVDERPAASAKGGAARPRARARVLHDAHDDGHGHEEDDEVDEEDDPTWWAPHAVMSALVLIGVLGFFGVFNKVLGGLAPHPAAGAEATDTRAARTEPAANDPSKGASPRPTPPPMATPRPAPPVPDDVKAAPDSAKKTASGLAYRVLKPGSGKSPKETDNVTVNYTGWTTDGKMFDSSITRGQPASFRLNQVIKGWTEGVPLMKVGETTRFWIPASLAYGEKPARPGAPSGMLVFDVELISIQ